MEILEIMQLDRWQHSELSQSPEKLKIIGHFKTKHSEESHKMRIVQQITIFKHQPELFWKKLEESSTTQKVKNLYNHIQTQKKEVKRLGKKIPQDVHTIKQIIDCKYSALPYIM